MSGLWLSDADVGIRELYAELAPACLVLSEEHLLVRLDAGERPSGLVVDGLTLRRMPPDALAIVLSVPRLAVCTGRTADVEDLVGRAQYRLLAKPFSLAEFESLLRWMAEAPATA